MDEHRDIYNKPEQKPAAKPALPAYESTPEEVRRGVRKRITYSVAIMLVLLASAAVYFYTQESDLERNPLAELLRGPGRSTGQTVRVVSTNALAGLPGLEGEFDPASVGRAPAHIPPQKMAEAMGHMRMANQYLVERDLEQAEQNVKRALAIWSDMNAGLRMLGVIYIHRGQFDQAILILERALQNDPFSSEALNNLATAYLQKGQLEKAEDLLLTSLQIRSENFTTQVNLGLLYLLWARYDQAAEHLEQAVQLAPENAAVRNNLGVALIRIGRFDLAREHFQFLVEKTPDRAQPFFNMAIAYALERKHTEALEWVTQGVQRCSPQEAQRHLMDSDYDGLRGLPEFQKLMRQLSEPMPNQPVPPPAS